MKRNLLPALLTTGLLFEATLSLASEGDLDSGFGNAGIVRAGSAQTGTFGVNGPLVQADGKIVVCGAGTSDDGARYGGFVSRFNRDGSPDVGFGTAGRVDLGTLFFDLPCPGLRLQGDGRILVASTGSANGTTVPVDTEAQVVRLNIDGSRDATFGDAGVAHVNFIPAANDTPSAMAIQPDGAIVLGFAINPRHFGLARLGADGRIDGSFGSAGRATLELPGDNDSAASVASVLIDSSGRILVAGSVNAAASSVKSFVAARALHDGHVDATFGTAGVATITFPGRDGYPLAMLLQDDGRIVMAGTAGARFSGSIDGVNYDVAVARLLDNGTPDPAFGDSGRKLVAIDLVPNANDAVYGGAIAPDKSIVLVGRAGTTYTSKGLILKLDPRATPIESFGTHGVRTFDVVTGFEGESSQVFQGVAFQGADYVIAGDAVDPVSNNNSFVLRLVGNSMRGHSMRPLPIAPLSPVRHAVP